MAQRESHSERLDKSSPVRLTPTELAAIGKRRLEELFRAHAELVEKLEASNRQWFDRAESEANLASEFTSTLTAARSIPDALAACAQWGSRRFELMAEDGKHLAADTQKFMEAGARLLATGWLSNGRGGLNT